MSSVYPSEGLLWFIFDGLWLWQTTSACCFRHPCIWRSDWIHPLKPNPDPYRLTPCCLSDCFASSRRLTHEAPYIQPNKYLYFTQSSLLRFKHALLRVVYYVPPTLGIYDSWVGDGQYDLGASSSLFFFLPPAAYLEIVLLCLPKSLFWREEKNIHELNS